MKWSYYHDNEATKWENSCHIYHKHLWPVVVVVQSLSHVQLFVTPWTEAHQASLPLQSPWVCSNSCQLSQWYYLTISFSAVPFSYCLQFLPASESFPVSWLFASGSQSIWASASVSVLLMNIQGWFPLGLTGLISLLPKGLSRVFSSIMVWKHQFFYSKPSLWSNSHILTWLLEKPQLWLYEFLLKVMSLF